MDSKSANHKNTKLNYIVGLNEGYAICRYNRQKEENRRYCGK